MQLETPLRWGDTALPTRCSRQRFLRTARVACEASQRGQQLQLFSPAKINIFLRILGKRPDGYHNLASLFHMIDFGDSMSIGVAEEAAEDSLACKMEGVPTDSSNLVMKALDLFRRKTGKEERFCVDLQKQIPHGAGLGGGSGNAATALWAANQLTGCPAKEWQLLKWAGEIGSDISVFFSEGAAFCTGRGEIVENKKPPLSLRTPLLLIKPKVASPTPAVFKALDLSGLSKADPDWMMASMTMCGCLTQSNVVNDLEAPAFKLLPELQELKQRLSADKRFRVVFMTGSGSTLVGVGSDDPPEFLKEYSNMFIQPTHLAVRQPGAWYSSPEL
ncbi:hypothetical protein WJX74_003040 [Apatococcus lobatus]|uniref:4-(cytidine 5'-diphospho)-2-C-methyl-D-erythritol kinase n=1 Tax=Apatococcus lobatus TaxID=904363 RepID=A0AAW1RL26_9CHLO